MSQVLALKAGTKRPFDEMAIDHHSQSVACSPHRISFLERPNFKRHRPTTTASYTTPQHHSIPKIIRKSTNNNNNNNNSNTMTKEEGEAMARHIPKRLRRIVSQVIARNATSSERLFTIDDVREIVESVCGEREKRVREECEDVMKERLTDQWKVFTRYHEDFVARSYRGRELSYLS